MIRVSSLNQLGGLGKRGPRNKEPQGKPAHPARRRSHDLPRASVPAQRRGLFSSSHDLVALGLAEAGKAQDSPQTTISAKVPPLHVASPVVAIPVWRSSSLFPVAESPAKQLSYTAWANGALSPGQHLPPLPSPSQFAAPLDPSPACKEPLVVVKEPMAVVVGFQVQSAPTAAPPESPSGSGPSSSLALSTASSADISSLQVPVTLYHTTLELGFVKELFTSASDMQAQVHALLDPDAPEAPPATVSGAVLGARLVGRSLGRAAKRVAAVAGQSAGQAGPASDPASEVLLARDALLTLAEWGWAEAFTLDEATADALGVREREVGGRSLLFSSLSPCLLEINEVGQDHDLPSARVIYLQRAAVGDSWVQNGVSTTDLHALRALLGEELLLEKGLIPGMGMGSLNTSRTTHMCGAMRLPSSSGGAMRLPSSGNGSLAGSGSLVSSGPLGGNVSLTSSGSLGSSGSLKGSGKMTKRATGSEDRAQGWQTGKENPDTQDSEAVGSLRALADLLEAVGAELIAQAAGLQAWLDHAPPPSPVLC